MNHILKTLASAEVDSKFEQQLDAAPFLVSQNDDTVLNLETLEVREREMEDYCSKQSVSRYLLGYEKKVPLKETTMPS